MNRMIDKPLERLRAAARRTRELASNRAGTGLGHEDADDDVGTIGTDGALGFDTFPLLEALHRNGARAVVIGQVAGTDQRAVSGPCRAETVSIASRSVRCSRSRQAEAAPPPQYAPRPAATSASSRVT